jgi:hypothetical protein
MGWKINFKLLNQSFSNTYQNRHNHRLIACMEVQKTNQRIGKKNWGQKVEM